MAAVEKLAADQSIPLIEFERGKRKEEIAAPLFERARLADRERVVLIGWAQERLNVFSPPNKQERQSGKFAPKRHPPDPRVSTSTSGTGTGAPPTSGSAPTPRSSDLIRLITQSQTSRRARRLPFWPRRWR